MSTPVVVVGRGVVSPAGVGVDALWASIKSATSHVSAEQLLDLQGLPIAAVSARFPQPALDDVLGRWSATRRSDGEALLWEVIDQAVRESHADSRHRSRSALLTTQLLETGFES